MSLEDLEEDGRHKRSVKAIIYDLEILFNLLVGNTVFQTTRKASTPKNSVKLLSTLKTHLKGFYWVGVAFRDAPKKIVSCDT